MWLFRFASLPGPTCVPRVIFLWRRGEIANWRWMWCRHSSPVLPETRHRLKIDHWLEKKKKKKGEKIKVNSLSAAWTESYSTPCPKPTGTGKWNNWCLLLLLFLFFLSEKQETTSSDCFRLSVLVFPLCCPQNSTDRPNIGRIIFFDSYSTDIWDAFISSSPSGIKY